MDKELLEKLYKDHKQASRCPSPTIVIRFFDELTGFLFPEHTTRTYESFDGFTADFDRLKVDFKVILSKRKDRNPERDTQLMERFFSALPEIRNDLIDDVDAIYNGDPAAKSHTEVIRTYPGFYAIAAYRIAHHLNILGLSLISRMISSHAHNKTGIDIHPAARIGRHFCIDHGTAIVIGETTEIGDHVKIYQGVTLGALSVKKEDAAKKRHPVIEDYVVIYAGASILGGKTVVGHNSVIGGNVWLTESVPPHSKIYYNPTFQNQKVE